MVDSRDIIAGALILIALFLLTSGGNIKIDLSGLAQPIQFPTQAPIIVNVPITSQPFFETTTTAGQTTTTQVTTTTAQPTTTTSQPIPEGTTGATCFDGIDNDGDGFIDFADNGCNQIGLADYDGDGLTNKQEYEGIQSAWGVTYKMDWNNADTDGDGYTDYDELYVFNTDPLNNQSYQASCRENDGGNTPTIPGSIWRNGSGYTSDPNQPWLTDLCQSWIDQYRLVEHYCSSATSHTNVIIDCRTIDPSYRCIAGASGGYCGIS